MHKKTDVRPPLQVHGFTTLGRVFKHRRVGCFTLLIDEIEKEACRTGIAQGPVVRFELDPIELAEFSKAIGLMPRISPTHSCDGAQLRKTKAALKPFIFVADETVVEIDVVGDEDTVAHKPHEAVRDLGEYRRAADHLVRDP